MMIVVKGYGQLILELKYIRVDERYTGRTFMISIIAYKAGVLFRC